MTPNRAANPVPIPRHLLAILFGLAGIGFLAILWFTQNGIGLWEDSFDYISAARGLLEGGRLGRIDGFGEFRPLTHFPPAYPWVLAGLEAIGIGAHAGARWLNALLFGGLILGSGWSVLYITRSAAWSILASIAVLLSEPLIGIHRWALSEPLFLALTMLTLWSISFHLAGAEGWRSLWLAVLAASLVPLTRFIGIGIVIAAGAALLLFSKRPPPARVKKSSLFVALAMLPTVGFMVRNYLVSSEAIDYPALTWHPPGSQNWAEAFKLALNWLLPDSTVLGMSDRLAIAAGIAGLVLLLACVLWAAVFFSRKRASEPGMQLFRMYLLFSAAYGAAFLSSVYLWRWVKLADERLILPLNWAGLVLLLSALALAANRGPVPLRAVIWLGAAAMFSIQIARARGLILTLPNDSPGFASERWRESETLAAVASFPPVTLFSNEIQAIYFRADRMAVFVPTPYNPATGLGRRDYEDTLETMRQMMCSEGARLVLFYPERLEEGYYQDLTAGLERVEEFSDGEWHQCRDG